MHKCINSVQLLIYSFVGVNMCVHDFYLCTSWDPNVMKAVIFVQLYSSCKVKTDVIYLLEWAVKSLSAGDCLKIMMLISLAQRCSKIQEALAGMSTDLALFSLAQWPNKKLWCLSAPLHTHVIPMQPSHHSSWACITTTHTNMLYCHMINIFKKLFETTNGLIAFINSLFVVLLFRLCYYYCIVKM